MSDRDTATRIAHLLTRTTFGPAPGAVDFLSAFGYDAALDAVLGDGFGIFGSPVGDVPGLDGDEIQPLIRWWLDRMLDPSAGLHEKLVWFWHDHFPSSVDKCSPAALRSQHETIRRHALGNFRDLARDVVLGGAMMQYLDAGGSVGSDPNENLARETMELFLLGRGNYGEADVRGAARALAGWWVDWESGEPQFDPGSAYPGLVEILGTVGRFNAHEFVDLCCDRPACTEHVAGRLHRFLVGSDASAERLVELGEVFRDHDLEIAPLVRAIVDQPSFDESVGARPRCALEWFVVAARALGLESLTDDHIWALWALDQMPFHPPNVGGWGWTDRWLAPSQLLARTNLLLDLTGGELPPMRLDGDDPVGSALGRCGLHAVSPSTRAALDEAMWAPLAEDDAGHLLVYLALLSPEAALA